MDSLPEIPNSMTPLVATRLLHCSRDGVATPLRIGIGMPQQDVETAGGMDWRCPVHWDDDGAVRVHSVCGIDALQALSLALEWVRHALVALAEAPGTSLSFLDAPYNAHTQLPDTRALRDAWQEGAG
jgi:hypothetical protein